MAHLQSQEFRRLVKWVLDSYAMYIARFGQDHAAFLVRRNLAPIIPVHEIPPHVYEDKEAPHGMEGEQRYAMVENEHETFREKLGNGPELQQQWDGVLDYLSAVGQLRGRDTITGPPSPITTEEEDSPQESISVQQPSSLQESEWPSRIDYLRRPKATQRLFRLTR
jgi:hypothetical protein